MGGCKTIHLSPQMDFRESYSATPCHQLCSQHSNCIALNNTPASAWVGFGAVVRELRQCGEGHMFESQRWQEINLSF